MMDTEKAVRKTHVDPSEIKHISQFYENESNFQREMRKTISLQTRAITYKHSTHKFNDGK